MGNQCATKCPACCNDLKPAHIHTIDDGPDAPGTPRTQEVDGTIAAISEAVKIPKEATKDPQAAESARQGSKSSRQDTSVADSQSTVASETAGDVGAAQKVVADFVKRFVKGVPLKVLSVSGGEAECIATLDRKLTSLSIARSAKKDAKKRSILLADVLEICIGQDTTEETDFQLDDGCVTLFLNDGSAVAFRFEDDEQRDTFALCMSMFVDGSRNQKEKKKSKQGK